MHLHVECLHNKSCICTSSVSFHTCNFLFHVYNFDVTSFLTLIIRDMAVNFLQVFFFYGMQTMQEQGVYDTVYQYVQQWHIIMRYRNSFNFFLYLRSMRSMRTMRWQGFFRSSDPGSALPAGERNQVTLLTAQSLCLTPLLDVGNTGLLHGDRQLKLKLKVALRASDSKHGPYLVTILV
jgi:hypothetical protein